ncbi:AraC family transcriptional regulator [Paenibacillus sp. CAA11]|uniref:AraC family transcriptional regulator n=1 Tax=Paenibacillus sp. CAA11 TaxID=1532905 RepID=UPI000D3AFBA0|nr:AraC family transcriptional regulator [Paenibacillus sp. CAA11]AWB45483.1 AraC family transcriptional regulator [Paenibacillus sp. CAA11]
MDKMLRQSLKESKIHGEDLLPFGAYSYAYGPGEHVVDCHWHVEAELFYVLEGEVLFQIDTDYFPVKAGEAVFIDGGDIHAGLPLGDDGCRFFALVFDMNLLASVQYDAIQERIVLPLQERKATFPRHIQGTSEAGQRLLQHISGIESCCSALKPGYEAAVKGHLFLMLHEIAAGGSACNRSISNTGSSAKIDRLKTVLLFIQQNYGRPIRLAELAGLIPMSEGQFCRFFKSMTRQTPTDYINSYRIRQAVELLRNEDRKISDIALEVGFDNISYFIRVFRKTMKCSPSEFRKGAEVQELKAAASLRHNNRVCSKLPLT